MLCLSLIGCSTSEKNEGLKDGVYQGVANGHAGAVSVEINVADGLLSEVVLVDHNETGGLGDIALNAIIEKMNESKSSNVEIVSGATKSSNAVIEAVKKGLSEAGADQIYFDNEQLISFETVNYESEYTFDVIVVGAGGAGIAAAIEAANTGASVAIIEKETTAGGNTLVSGGGLNVPNSRQQVELGIEDSVELFYNDTLKGGDNIANEDLVRVMADNALAAADWLEDDIDVNFMSDRVQQFGGHSAARAIIPDGNKGTELIKKLTVEAKELGVEIFYSTRASELKMIDNKVAIVNALYQDETIVFNANSGVVLATGGFASDVEMRKQYNENYDERFMSTAVSGSTGDGIKMAQQLNAGLVDMDQIQVYPTCNAIDGIISYVANSRFDGAVLVNQEGTRFVNEMGRRDVISNAILEQTDSYSYLVWGQEVESVGNMTQVHSAEFEQWLSDDLIYVADSISDAANHYGIDEKQLVATIDAYNESIKDKTDEDFQKSGTMLPISEGNFYIQKVVPSAHHTMGGITINTDAQVLDVEQNKINGLFAAGEVVGGIHGTNRLGGNAITDCIVFGRIAGQNVVK